MPALALRSSNEAMDEHERLACDIFRFSHRPRPDSA
jgi:hypothetical protein